MGNGKHMYPWYQAKDNTMRRPGIEPGASRWQRDILPLNQRRVNIQYNPDYITSHRLVSRTTSPYCRLHSQTHDMLTNNSVTDFQTHDRWCFYSTIHCKPYGFVQFFCEGYNGLLVVEAHALVYTKWYCRYMLAMQSNAIFPCVSKCWYPR